MKKLFTLSILLSAGLAVNAQTIPNGNMEGWHPASLPINLQIPDNGWYNLDSFAVSLAKTYLKPSGTYAQQNYPSNISHAGLGAKLRTRVQDTIGMTAAVVSNCEDTINIGAVITPPYTHPLNAVGFKGGTNISAAAHRPASVGVWLEYFPNGADTAHIIANVLNASGAVIGTVDTTITATISTYTYINPTIHYTTTTGYAKLQVICMSSPLGYGRGKDSSILYVDDIGYVLATNVEELSKTTAVSLHPNPSAGIVYIYSNVTDKISWQVFNTSGQVVAAKELVQNNREDLSGLASGTYFYNIYNSKGQIIQKDKFVIAK